MGAPLEQLTGAHGLVARRYEPLADGLLERRPDQTRLLQSLQKTNKSRRWLLFGVWNGIGADAGVTGAARCHRTIT